MAHREIVQRIRKAARVALTGRASRFADDEAVAFMLNAVVPERDALPGRRLTVLTPALSARAAFGGVATLVELPLQIFRRALGDKGWSVRFVCFGERPADDDNLALLYPDRLNIPGDRVAVHYPARCADAVPVAAGDLFLGSMWSNFYDAQTLIDFQHATFGGARAPYVSMIQDYEPGFYPWSSAYLMARGSYDSPRPKKLIFNSHELETFYRAQGHPDDERQVFEPVMNARLAERIPDARAARKDRQILLYCRPDERRNCYYLVRKAVELWSHAYAAAAEWRIVSVGAAHAPFALKAGVESVIRNKLSLDAYADELARSAVGMSLMASPHPSYPPLEMAHYGALTITNSFACKDLSAWHDNIVSLPAVTPERLCEALCRACDAFAADPGAGIAGRSHKPRYLKGHDDDTLDRIGAMLLAAARPSPLP